MSFSPSDEPRCLSLTAHLDTGSDADILQVKYWSNTGQSDTGQTRVKRRASTVSTHPERARPQHTRPAGVEQPNVVRQRVKNSGQK